MAIYSSEKINCVRFLYTGSVLLLIAVGLSALWSEWTDDKSNPYEMVHLPQNPNTVARYCITAWAEGERVALQRFVTGGLSICISHDGEAKWVYSSLGTYTRAFTRYDLTCNDGSETCINITTTDWSTDCQVLYDDYKAAVKSQSAFSNKIYTIKYIGTDRDIWGEMCKFKMNRVLFTCLALIPMLGSLFTMCYAWNYSRTVHLVQRCIETDNSVISKFMNSLTRNWYSHVKNHWLYELIVNVWFALNDILGVGIVYNKEDFTSAVVTIIVGTIGVIKTFWWVRTACKELEVNPNFSFEYRLLCVPWCIYFVIWVLESVGLWFTIDRGIKSGELTTAINVAPVALKVITTISSLKELFEQRPFSPNISLDILDGNISPQEALKMQSFDRPES